VFIYLILIVSKISKTKRKITKAKGKISKAVFLSSGFSPSGFMISHTNFTLKTGQDRTVDLPIREYAPVLSRLPKLEADNFLRGPIDKTARLERSTISVLKTIDGKRFVTGKADRYTPGH